MNGKSFACRCGFTAQRMLDVIDHQRREHGRSHNKVRLAFRSTDAPK